jgi:hypothetical protein
MTVRRLIRAAALAAAAAILVIPLQGSGDGFFDDASVLEFTVEAPLQQLFDQGVHDESFSVPAKIAAGASTPIAAELSIRGNTSRKECPFPKLKLKMQGRPDAFGGLRTVKINTHCGEAPDDALTKDFGRLANERSPWREGVVYRIAGAAGARTARTRPARITYVDSSPSTSSRRLVRNALIVEDDDDVRKRLEGTGEITPAEFTNAREVLSPDDVARVAFTEALIGNFDWCLMMYPNDEYRCDARKKLWNLMVLRTPSGAVPVLQDFDLAGPVTGRHVWFDHAFTRDFTASEIDTEVIAQVQRTRTLFDRARLDRIRRDFLARRQAITRVIEASAVDPRGADLSRAYVDAFFRAIADDRDFYRPVIARAGVRIFADAAGRTEACGIGDTVPPGTPFKELRRENGRAQVQLLDALWRWAPPNECVPVHKGPVWIDPSAISDDFPAGASRARF